MRTIPGWMLLAGGLVLQNLVGCVTAKTHEQVKDALASERRAKVEAREEARKLEAELGTLNEKLQRAERNLAKQADGLEQRDRELAQRELDASVLAQERAQSTLLVGQLREELGRVGSHLETYSGKNQELGRALREAEEKVRKLTEIEQRAAERALLIKDLTLGLALPLSAGKLELVLAEGRPVLRMPLERLMDKKSDVIARVARVTKLYAGTRIEVRVPKTERTADPRALTKRLTDQGLDERSFVLQIAGTAPKSSGQVELAFLGS